MSTLVTLELSGGTEVAIQTNDAQTMPHMGAAISFDSKQGNHTFWLRKDELAQLSVKITEALNG